VLQGREFVVRVQSSIRRLPNDLALVLVVTALVNGAVFLSGLRGTPLQTVLGLAFVTVVPGYALISALFPEADQSVFRREDDPAGDEITMDRWDISGVERAALSIGLSVAVVALVGIASNFTRWGVQLMPIMMALDVLILSATAVAVRRRLALPPEERFHVWLFPYASFADKIISPETSGTALLNLTLLTLAVIAAGSVGFALGTPSPAEATTEFYLLTENNQEELMTADYPEDPVVGNSSTLIVGVDNNEFERVEYTVVVQLQKVERVNNEVQVLDRRELARFERSLPHDETWQESHDITPPFAGEDLRLQYLLYRNAPPDEPTVETAYRSLHLWVDVSDSSRTDTERSEISSRLRHSPA